MMHARKQLQKRRLKAVRLQRQNRAMYRNIVPRGLKLLKMHHFKQTFQPTANTFRDAGVAVNGTYIAAPNGIVYGPTITALDSYFFSMVFTFADLPQASSYTTLFDCYKINKIVVKFTPLQNMVPLKSLDTAGANQNGVSQPLETVLDFDDPGLLSSRAALLEYETFKSTPAYREHKRVFVPRISTLEYKTSGTTIGYSQARPRWIDSAYTDVEDLDQALRIMELRDVYLDIQLIQHKIYNQPGEYM